jgi:hypothetical protein
MSVKTIRVTVGDNGEVTEMSPTTNGYTWDQAVVDQKLALLKLAPVYSESSEVPGVGRRRARCVFYVRLYDGEYQHLEK